MGVPRAPTRAFRGDSRGYVEQIPVLKRNRFLPTEEWYRDKETGEVYSLVGPEERIRGHWSKIDPQDLLNPGERVQ